MFTISWRFLKISVVNIRIYKCVFQGTSPLSFDDQSVFEFTMECNSLISSTTRFYPLRVAIEDTNDNAPIFVGAPYTIAVSEVTLTEIKNHEQYLLFGKSKNAHYKSNNGISRTHFKIC